MHTAALLVACLACVGTGRRVQKRPLEADSNSQQGLAALLLGLQPDAAIAGLEDIKLGRLPNGAPSVDGRSQVEPEQHVRSPGSDHQWQDGQRQRLQLISEFARLRGGQYYDDDEEDEEDEDLEDEEDYRSDLVRASEEERMKNSFRWASGTGDRGQAADDEEDYEEDGVQFVITTKMRLQLAQLGYRPSEVATLDPERAAAIISRRIMRPANGVPSSWTRSYRGRPSLNIRKVEKAFKKLLLPAVLILSASGVLKVGPLSDLFDGVFGGSDDYKKPERKKTQKKKKPAHKKKRRSDDGPDLNPDDTWLDQQIDRLLYFLSGKR